MTAAIAYDAASAVSLPPPTELDSPIEQLAVAWAVVRFAGSTPTTVRERAVLDQAHARVFELAATLGADEDDLRSVLRRRYEHLMPERDAGPVQRRNDAPA